MCDLNYLFIYSLKFLLILATTITFILLRKTFLFLSFYKQIAISFSTWSFLFIRSDDKTGMTAVKKENYLDWNAWLGKSGSYEIRKWSLLIIYEMSLLLFFPIADKRQITQQTAMRVFWIALPQSKLREIISLLCLIIIWIFVIVIGNEKIFLVFSIQRRNISFISARRDIV